MKSEKRIIPISSGKGGVGKSTFALNYALGLAEHGPTVLIDLDMGTSSVRHAIDCPVPYDLYHFFRKDRALADCVTTLPARLDPAGRFRNFGFVAAPKHLIEDITNMRRPRREKLIDAINALDVRFVVLDIKAGLDSNVIGFLPYSNSGVLVFTPHLQSATMAAADIVKAILFRKLRSIFAPESSLYQVVKGLSADGVNALIDAAEDPYENEVQNLDAFIDILHDRLGDHPIVRLVTNTVHYFRVAYVLNMFDGVEQSYETAVRPFVENLVESVSSHLTVVNLGWVMAHPDVQKANARRVPILLGKEANAGKGLGELTRLASQYLTGKARPPVRAKADAGRYLQAELEILTRMSNDLAGASIEDNIQYVVARTLHVLSSRRLSDLGDNQIFKRFEFERVLAQRGR